jgi:allophanate hydrolase subunit 1
MPFAFGIENGYSLGIKNRLLIQEILVFLKKKEDVLELIPGVTSLLIKYKEPFY